MSESLQNKKHPNISFHREIRSLLRGNSLFNSIKQISIFSTGGMLAQLIMMVYAIIVARQLGPDRLGIYSGLYAILGVTITVVNFGLDQWMLKEAHNYKSVRSISGQVISIKILFGLLWCVFFAIFLPISRPQAYIFPIVILGVGDVLSDVIFNTVTNSWTITRNIKKINILLLLSRAGKLIFLLLLMLINQITISNVIGSRFIVSLIILSISLYILKPLISINKVKNLISTIKQSTVFGLSEILAMIYGQIDVAILSYFSIRDTGLYAPASGLIHALFIIPNSVFVYLIPFFSKKIDVEKDFNILNISIIVLSIFSLIGSILTIGLLITGDSLIDFVLGNQFSNSALALKVLSPIMLFKSLSFGLAMILIITSNQQKRLLPQMIVCVFNITLNIILIPRYGLISVAWIYTISELILMLGYLFPVIGIIKNGNKQTFQAK